MVPIRASILKCEVDYLLKPFDDERLRSSVERAAQRIAARHQSDLAGQLQALLDSRAQMAGTNRRQGRRAVRFRSGGID